MDGPTIAKATEVALAGGVRVRDALRAVEAISGAGGRAVVMTYWNPVLRWGVDAFARDLASAGGLGLITPDLIPDEAGDWVAASEKHDLDRIFLVAPSSTPGAAGRDHRSLARVRLRRVDHGCDRRARCGVQRRSRVGAADSGDLRYPRRRRVGCALACPGRRDRRLRRRRDRRIGAGVRARRRYSRGAGLNRRARRGVRQRIPA